MVSLPVNVFILATSSTSPILGSDMFAYLIPASLANNYTGNLILQKTYRENHITKKTLVNNGELSKYHAENTHEAIVTAQEYEQVQEELRNLDSVKGKKASPKYYPFTGLIICDKCGSNYRRKTTAYKHVWNCGNYLENGKTSCNAKQVPEEVLQVKC